jgi:hypothetical protein
VHWLTADIRPWRPWRRCQAWHDRAVFHFLTTGDDRGQDLQALHHATAAASIAVFGCSLPAARGTARACLSLATARRRSPRHSGVTGI